MNIGKNIKERREKLGLTQLQLVERAKEYVCNLEKEGITIEKGFDQAMLSKWENGEKKPNIDKVRLLSTLLNISMGELLDGEQQNDIIKIFYDEGFELARKYYKGSNSMNLKLHNAVKLQNSNQLIILLLEMFVASSKEMPTEMSQIILEYIQDHNFKKFEVYIYSFQMGFHNGVNS